MWWIHTNFALDTNWEKIFARPKKAHNDQNNNHNGVMCVTQYSLPDYVTSAHSILSVQNFYSNHNYTYTYPGVTNEGWPSGYIR